MTKLWKSVLVAASIFMASASDVVLDEDSKNRHSGSSRPFELNVDAKATYNDKFMALMESPCRPESDGYFGATSGVPMVVTYQFQMESKPLSNVKKILDMLGDTVTDSILSQAFPKMCGFGDRLLKEYPVSGFRFYEFEEVGKCEPKADRMDFCGVLKGQVNVYSRDLEKGTEFVADIIEETLNPPDPTMLHAQMISLTLQREDMKRNGGMIPSKRRFDGSALAWIGFFCLLFAGIYCFWRNFLRKEHKRLDSSPGLASQRNRRRLAWNRLQNKRKETHIPYESDETSIGPTDESESISPLYYRDVPAKYLYFDDDSDSRYQYDIERNDNRIV